MPWTAKDKTKSTQLLRACIEEVLEEAKEGERVSVYPLPGQKRNGKLYIDQEFWDLLPNTCNRDELVDIIALDTTPKVDE
jgi:hypothetical protein